MSLRRLLLLLLPAGAMTLVGSLAGCSSGGGQEPVTVDISSVRPHLQTLSQARILLGHQSVGRDVLAGLESLAAEAGVPLRIVEIQSGLPPDDAPGVFHSNIGENGDPDGKCEVFGQLLSRPERPAYDLAMMKFCYVDLAQDTPLSVAKMLERYARVVRDIATLRPDVQLVHISLPLRSDPPGRRTMLKRLLKRPTEEDADNVLRNDFNAKLREQYSGEPFFDLATLQSTLPDGSRSSFTRDGRTVYTLASRYTYDGGHLKPEAQRYVAADFARSLALALEQSRS